LLTTKIIGTLKTLLPCVTVTEVPESVVGHGSALGSTRVAGPKLLPYNTKIDPWAMPKFGCPKIMLLAAFCTDAIDGAWAKRHPEATKQKPKTAKFVREPQRIRLQIKAVRILCDGFDIGRLLGLAHAEFEL
jgi:hypothetical protein